MVWVNSRLTMPCALITVAIPAEHTRRVPFCPQLPGPFAGGVDAPFAPLGALCDPLSPVTSPVHSHSYLSCRYRPAALLPALCQYATCVLSCQPLPVSYTHLRAHETRHDLVCRLLLEKKKKK